jgi:predicted transcriptional regulator
LHAGPNDDVWSVLQRMDEHDVNQIPVMEGDTFLGMITRENLLHEIRLRAELNV